MTTLVWFRQDLRLGDNPALHAAVQGGGRVIPVYLYAPSEEAPFVPGAASRWWLHHSLERLDAALRELGSHLTVRQTDDSLAALTELVRETGATRVVWNRRYEPARIAHDQRIKFALRERGIDTGSFNGALLREPWTVKTKTGGPFQVFTPYWRNCLADDDPADPLPAPRHLESPETWPASSSISALALLPRLPWAGGLAADWTPGSAAAQTLLADFLAKSFADYGTLRDQPGVRGTSRMSPYLHFGEISPRQIWHATRHAAQLEGRHTTWRTSQFLTELGWREFAHHLLYHFPQTPQQPLRANYARFPWQHAPDQFRAWSRGMTGYPIVDAGMRELWHTGWMHNRVRMIVGSFLIKDLLISWTEGAAWFWDTLVDADLASNTLGWQWVAGCGADASPFFRIFNPMTQGAKFDPEGAYVRRWVPELAALPTEFIHAPWTAPGATLQTAGVTLGHQYPLPMVDHAVARRMALEALSAVKT